MHTVKRKHKAGKRNHEARTAKRAQATLDVSDGQSDASADAVATTSTNGTDQGESTSGLGVDFNLSSRSTSSFADQNGLSTSAASGFSIPTAAAAVGFGGFGDTSGTVW